MKTTSLVFLLGILFFNTSIFAFNKISDNRFVIVQKSNTTKVNKKKSEKENTENKSNDKNKESIKDKIKEKLSGDKSKLERGGRFGDRRFEIK